MLDSAPKAFVSYSWDTPEHKAWVRDLATRLRGDGIDVSLDQWSTVPGDQLPRFMEESIRQSAHVLIICTPKYKGKADGRQGGVGYEGDIITAEVFNGASARKFIPILRHDVWQEAAATWLLGKYYVDLHADPYSEDQYEDLLNTLWGTRPSAPPLGRKPIRAVLKSMGGEFALHPGHALLSRGQPDEFVPIRILGIIADEVSAPLNDGSRGSALYRIPLRLSAIPSPEWIAEFVNAFDHPSQYTTMHRPGILSVHGDRAILNGTRLEEVESYHRKTLMLALQQANSVYAQQAHARKQAWDAKQRLIDQSRLDASEAAKRIKFDDDESQPKSPALQYLSDHDSELGQAIFLMGLRSAWGRWFAAQHLAGNSTPIPDRQLMMIASGRVVEKAMDGTLEIRGRPTTSIQYEAIPPEAWRLTCLGVEPDPRRIWAFPVQPRDGVDPARISRFLGYDSLIVDSRQFESIWPMRDPMTDTKRRELLEQARKDGVDPLEIQKLS